MKTYDVTQYETWLRTIRVVAESPAAAIRAVYNLDSAPGQPEGVLEFDGVDMMLGQPPEDIGTTEAALLAVGIELDDGVVGSIKDVVEV